MKRRLILTNSPKRRKLDNVGQYVKADDITDDSETERVIEKLMELDVDYYFEQLTGFSGDLTVIGNGFQIKTHSILLRRSKSIMMICQQPSNIGRRKRWHLDKSITKQAAFEFLKNYYEEEKPDYNNLKPWDWDPYLFLMGQHLDKHPVFHNNKRSKMKFLRMGIINYISKRLKKLLCGIDLEKDGFGELDLETRQEITACFEFYCFKKIRIDTHVSQLCFTAMSDQDDAENICKSPFKCWVHVTMKDKSIMENYYWWTYGIWSAICEGKPWMELQKIMDMIDWDEQSKLEGFKNAFNFFHEYYKYPTSYQTRFLHQLTKWCCS